MEAISTPSALASTSLLDLLTQSTTLFLLSALLALGLTIIYHAPLLHWLKLKRYQYEVTFSLYMLTPTEKFIFNSVLFLILSMIIIAASLYLPEHITMVANRAWYYAWGDEGVKNGNGGAVVGTS